MADEKRIRISADTTPLQELREKAVSLYREINQSASIEQQTIEKNIQKLKEELSLMKDRNELEKLLIDLKKQNRVLNQSNQQVVSSTTTERDDQKLSSIEWYFGQSENEEVEKKKSKKRKKKTEEKDFSTSEPIVYENGSVEWKVEYEDDIDKQQIQQPSKKRKKRKFTDNSDDDYDNESNIVLREINRHVENIDESVTNKDESKTNINRSEKYIDESKTSENRHIENKDESITSVNRSQNYTDESVTNRNTQTENVVENIKNIDRNVENISEKSSLIHEFIKEDNTNSSDKYDKNDKKEENFSIKDKDNLNENKISRETVIKFDDEKLLKALDSVNGSIDRGSRSIAENLSKVLDKYSEKDKESTHSTMTNRYLNTIADIVSRIEDVVVNDSRGSNSIPYVNNNGNNTNSSNGDFNPLLSFLGGQGGLMGGVMSKLLGPLALGGLIVSAVNGIKNTALNRIQRNYEFEYQSPTMTSIERQAAEVRLRGQNKADDVRWIPLVGDYLAKRRETQSEAEAQAIQISRQTRLGMESGVSAYTQTLGNSTNQNFGSLAKEGSYAARSLGMDFSQYAQRFGEIVRAGGGTFRGGTDQDPLAKKEIQSLMGIERLYGLTGINQLQSVMRFGDRNENLGSSAVIKSFERVMQRLEISFSEIASTMDESLQTFTTEASKILEKQGDFDSGQLAATLAGVREYTGASGRRLERYQQMATGSSLSQDDVTNAIVLRAIRNNTNARTFSEVMSEKENLANRPDLMKAILKDAQGMTSTNEQFIQVLKQMIPNLSYSDLQDLSKRGNGRIDIDSLFESIQKVVSEIGRKGEERGIEQQYNKDVGAQTVGSETATSAQDRQRMLGAVEEIRDLIKKSQQSESERKTEEQFKEYKENPKQYQTNNPGNYQSWEYARNFKKALENWEKTHQ